MKSIPHRFCHYSRRGAFSLVEVTISLGIVSFGLVAVLGTLPVALSSAQSSITQTRATALAGCLYASFRSQPFGKICYADSQLGSDGVTPKDNAAPTPINLFMETNASGSTGTIFFASIVSLPGQAAGAVDPRRIKYTTTRQPDSTYQLVLHCNNQPDGVPMSGIANRVEIAVSPLDRVSEIYKFSSVISNRSGSALGVTSS